MAIFVGQRLRGVAGATVAVVAMLTGPFFAIILAALSYQWLVGLSGFPSVVEGVAAVALGMLARVGLTAARSATRGVVPALAMVATIFGVGIMHWPMLAVVGVIAPISVIACYVKGGARA